MDGLRVFASVVACLLALLAFCPALVSSQVTQVGISPDEQEVHPYDVFTVTVVVDPATQIAGAQFDMRFDPSVVRVISVTEGDLFKGGGRSTYFKAPTIMNDNGRLVGAASVVLGPYTVSSSGSLAVIQMAAENVEGASDLVLENVKVVNQMGQSVGISVSGATVRVVRAPEGGGLLDRNLAILIGVVIIVALVLLVIAILTRWKFSLREWKI